MFLAPQFLPITLLSWVFWRFSFSFVLGNFSLGAFHGKLLKVFSLPLHKLNLIFSCWSRKLIRRDFCFVDHVCLFLNYWMKRTGGAVLIYYFICHSFIQFLLHAWMFCCLVFVLWNYRLRKLPCSHFLGPIYVLNYISVLCKNRLGQPPAAGPVGWWGPMAGPRKRLHKLKHN